MGGEEEVCEKGVKQGGETVRGRKEKQRFSWTKKHQTIKCGEEMVQKKE